MEKKYHFSEEFSVRFAETDAAGLAHFSNFLRWAENAEGEFFRRNGLHILEKSPTGTLSGWPRVAVQIAYRAPARYADRIRVGIRPQTFPPENARSVNWEFRITRIENDATETLLAEGSWTTVYARIRADGNVAVSSALPEAFLDALRRFS